MDKFKLEIENNSWLKNETFSLKERIKFFFTRGYFSVNLEKLKKINRLNEKIDFKAEKAFFLKANFFALFNCGIIRWLWFDKEKFATKWAKQVILLKIKEDIEATNENFSKASLLLKVLKIYHEVFFFQGKKDFFSELCVYINQASIKYFYELGRLFKKINSRIGYRSEADFPLELEVGSDNTTNSAVFFNNRNKEQEPLSQSSLLEIEACCLR